jgi:ferrous iron transport protein A
MSGNTMYKKTVSDLLPEEEAVIIGLERTPKALKLIEMGCIPGKTIQLIRIAPLGSPYYCKIGTQALALRKEEVAEIIVQ